MLDITITSPEKCYIDAKASHISLPGENGDFEIYPSHCAMISLLKTGAVVAHLIDSEPFVLYIDAGIVEISGNCVSILIDSAHQARLDEQDKLLAQQRQCRRDIQNQEKVDYHALLKQLNQLSAELLTIDKERQYRKKH
jgi:F-type H+-transporting ATPase subunit epsilon